MLLNVSNVHKSFGVDEILRGVTFRLDRKEKVALIGRNGTGKTTLLKILTGQMDPDTGSVHIARGAKIGYLRQEALATTKSVIEEAEEARKHELQLRARLEELEKRLEDNPSDEDLEEYALVHEHFLEAEGYSAERDLRTVLQRMGFEPEEFDKPASKLSGGEKTRLALAKLLLEEPDLLILDEPTNHLDLQATEWLEGWLNGYHGAVLLVSHDRTFLQNTARRVIEMREGQVKSYEGSFDKFLKLRAEEDARQAEVAKRQQEQIDKMDEFVRRFMNSERTAQARGRLRHLEKLKASAVQAPKNDRGMAAGIKASKRSGDIVLDAQGLEMAYPATPLFKNVDWTIRWGERWGVVGENGAGKSTLIRILLGKMEPLAGTVRHGSNVEVGYFAQDTVELNQDQSPLDFMVYECGLLPAEARNLLGRYLFSGDDVFRPIRTLSGGEKNKLVLARLTTLNPNLLVLDEPTNHLDMDSREALAQVLKEYRGTLILVSHDRWLLSQVTEQTLDLRRSGPVFFPGSYEEYRRRASKPAAQTRRNGEPEKRRERESEGLSPRELSKEIVRLTKLVADIEAAVSDGEEELREVEQALANLPADADVFALTRRHGELQEELAGRMASWEEQSVRLEELRALQSGE